MTPAVHAYVPCLFGRRHVFVHEPGLDDKSTVELVSEMRDEYARKVFTRLFGGKMARHWAAANRPEGT